jgi:aspartyl-tRNA(Asn)/glutamyl-tRNA(Gln) amidotransferase subunit A
MAPARSSPRAETDLGWMSATELATLIRRKKVSPVEVVGAVLARIEKLNPILNAYVTLTAEQARPWVRSTACRSR